jgi:pyruvate-formate lyase-activating enzyme
MVLSNYADWRLNRSLPFQLSRGCTDRCEFCSEWVFWQHFRSTPAEHSVEQLAQLQTTYGLTGVRFSDSLLNGHKGRLEEFADATLKRGLRLNWGGFMRADMDRPTAQLLARSGCEFVFLGIESLADETLTDMNKRRSGAESMAAIEALLDAGIVVETGVIAGFPGDDRTRFMETLAKLRGLGERHPGQLRISIEAFRPTPNQPIYARMAEFGLRPRRWPESVQSIEPFLADIVQDIYWQVDGSNQGLERLTQNRYGHNVSAEIHVPSKAGLGWGSRQDVAYRSFTLTETRTHRSYAHLVDGRGAVHFAILDESEAQSLESMWRARAEGSDPLEDAAFATAWRAVEAKHVAVGRLDPTGAGRAIDLRRDGGQSVVLSSLWAARVMDAEDPEGLVLASVFQGTDEDVLASPSVAPLLARTATGPVRMAELLRWSIENFRTAQADVSTFLEDLMEAGVLLVGPQ